MTTATVEQNTTMNHAKTTNIAKAVDKLEALIHQKLACGMTTVEELLEKNRQLRVTFTVHQSYKRIQEEAFIMGFLSLSDYNILYGYIGDTPEWFNEQTLPVKVAVAKTCAELFKAMHGRLV